MKDVRRILFAVKDPAARRHAALDKAIQLASSLGARLELFNAISTPVFLELEPLTGSSIAELRRESLALRKRQLEKLAARSRAKGVDTTCSVEWDFPPHEAIVRRVALTGADLVIAEVHVGRRLAPWLVHLTDWELLRQCPVPVLLLRHTRGWNKPVVVAAVDPSHAHSKPAALDEKIVAEAARLARTLAGRMEIVHANFPPAIGVGIMGAGLEAATLAASYEAQLAFDRREFDAFADRADIPRSRRHVLLGDPVAVIPKAARQLGAGIIVMGALSRSGLKRLLIGNTAERVLASLPCDVLVVKPPNVTKPVTRQPRGMRVVAQSVVVPQPV